MRIDMRIDIWIDMQIDMWIDVQQSPVAQTPPVLSRSVYGRMCTAVCIGMLINIGMAIRARMCTDMFEGPEQLK